MSDTQNNTQQGGLEPEGGIVKLVALIVDDDQIIRESLEGELKRAFFTSFGAANGAEALGVVDSREVDIVLLDVNLPDANGLDLLQKIKERRPDCQVIIMTGYGGEEIAIRALRRGAIDYIEKPIQPKDLAAALGRAQEKLVESQQPLYKSVVLVLDDEEAAVRLVKRALEKENFFVYGATQPAKGLEIIAENRIDIVVTDINMAGMDGLEFLEKAKTLYPDIEGIVMTGANAGDYAVRALRLGAMDFIKKPVDLDELLYAMEKAIERIRLNRNRTFRSRELKITAEIFGKMNEELEHRIDERTKELAKTQTQLIQTSKLSTLGEMAAGLAHEINQPLGGISLVAMTFRKMLERNKLTNADIEKGIQDIDACVKRMSAIITHIRTFARQESLAFKEFDLPETIENAMHLMGEQLRLREIEVVKEIEADLPKCVGEPFQIEQIWINLIGNARDIMDDKQKMLAGQEASGEKYCKKDSRFLVTHEKEAKRVKIVVSDNGMGMPDEVKKKIFEPFFTTKGVGKGTGLGLSITYGIIEAHHGTIEVESRLGEGTDFIIYLPTEVAK